MKTFSLLSHLISAAALIFGTLIALNAAWSLINDADDLHFYIALAVFFGVFLAWAGLANAFIIQPILRKVRNEAHRFDPPDSDSNSSPQ